MAREKGREKKWRACEDNKVRTMRSPFFRFLVLAHASIFFIRACFHFLLNGLRKTGDYTFFFFFFFFFFSYMTLFR